MNEHSEIPVRALPNGGLWPDAAGIHINAHGGGLLKEGRLEISWRDSFSPAAEDDAPKVLDSFREMV